MNIFQRFGYFSVGLIMGIAILMFFLGGKKTSCDYSPNARVLKNIRIKERNFSKESLAFFQNNNIDTSFTSYILEEGNVDFSNSQTKKEPCKVYLITGEREEKTIEMQIENCKESATIQSVNFKD